MRGARASAPACGWHGTLAHVAISRQDAAHLSEAAEARRNARGRGFTIALVAAPAAHVAPDLIRAVLAVDVDEVEPPVIVKVLQRITARRSMRRRRTTHVSARIASGGVGEAQESSSAQMGHTPQATAVGAG